MVKNTSLYSDSDLREKKEEIMKVDREIQRFANRFGEYDKNGDMKLDFEEFLAMQPRSIRDTHSSTEIQQWFEKADSNGDGTLSVNEFFGWVLNTVTNTQGSASLEAAFKAHDKDGSGLLDYKEFEAVAIKMGFGAVAYNIFRSLDQDFSGAVSYKELIASVMSNSGSLNPDVTRLCTSLMLAYQDDSMDPVYQAGLDTSKWVIRGNDVETIRSELQDLLRKSGAHVTDLLKLFDQDHDTIQEIDDIEFCTAMRNKLGFKGNGKLLFDVFKSLDVSGDGQIGFDELFEFVRGRRHSLDKRNIAKSRMRIAPPKGSGRSLEEIIWDTETLRILFQQAVDRCSASPMDIIRTFDKSGDGMLNPREFVAEMKNLFEGHLELWDREVRTVTENAFNEADQASEGVSSHGFLDVIEIGKWLAAPTARSRDQQVRFKKRSSVVAQPDGAQQLRSPTGTGTGGSAQSARLKSKGTPRSPPRSRVPAFPAAPPATQSSEMEATTGTELESDMGEDAGEVDAERLSFSPSRSIYAREQEASTTHSPRPYSRGQQVSTSTTVHSPRPHSLQLVQQTYSSREYPLPLLRKSSPDRVRRLHSRGQRDGESPTRCVSPSHRQPSPRDSYGEQMLDFSSCKSYHWPSTRDQLASRESQFSYGDQLASKGQLSPRGQFSSRGQLSSRGPPL